MSLKAWKKKYYPKKPTIKMTWLQAIDHSITKWSGMDADTLEEYGLYVSGGQIWEVYSNVDPLEVNSSSCALCIKTCLQHGASCHGCPIMIMRGEPCDNSQGSNESEYAQWQEKHDPKPMQKLLDKTLEYIQANPDKFS